MGENQKIRFGSCSSLLQRDHKPLPLGENTSSPTSGCYPWNSYHCCLPQCYPEWGSQRVEGLHLTGRFFASWLREKLERWGSDFYLGTQKTIGEEFHKYKKTMEGSHVATKQDPFTQILVFYDSHQADQIVFTQEQRSRRSSSNGINFRASNTPQIIDCLSCPHFYFSLSLGIRIWMRVSYHTRIELYYAYGIWVDWSINGLIKQLLNSRTFVRYKKYKRE